MDFVDKSKYMEYIMKILKENIKINIKEMLSSKTKDDVASQLVPAYFQKNHPSFTALRYNICCVTFVSKHYRLESLSFSRQTWRGESYWRR